MARKPSKEQISEAPPTASARIPCPESIIEKVGKFHEHIDTYRAGDYSEAQLRIDFLNPMLEALGWDVDNKAGYAEAYRDVVYEDALKIGGTSKAPDYGFYIGGRAAGGGRKFFLEAKKPSASLRVDPKPAFQLRRYAYSAQLPLSILTNFREFIVYDTRLKPGAKDSATAGAIVTLKYTEYPNRWHDIASIFSREAILRGSFDKFARAKRKKGMEPLGEAFLKDIEQWRADLAKEIASSNPDITVEDLNFAVQRTIDRIIFLRICEDRGIEPIGNLQQLLNGGQVYARMGQIFRGADDRYNSGIFHFPAAGKRPDPDRTEAPDDLTLDLELRDQPIKKLIRGLYDQPNLYTAYEFSFIPPEILGQVYEQFLGKVITLTPAHRVRIEEKPEVRKAGGVYYTPSYIVDYIVRNTVGVLMEGKAPKEAAKLRILDPASGSGSFLIGAYQYLLDWHLRWYLDNDPDSHCKGANPPLMRTPIRSLDGTESKLPSSRSRASSGRYDYRLTTAKRKEILLNSIYGVDIDDQAVEVTKLSLLLKVLEGESHDSINAQVRIFHQRALPDLGKNIKCGNSLISDDFNDTDLSEGDRKRINKFNWQREFPRIFRSGGFDAVIGNPPYIFGEYHNVNTKPYLETNMRTAKGQYDTYWLFIERGVQLTRKGGRFSLIVPDALLARDQCESVRETLISAGLTSLYHCGSVFLAGVSAVVFTIEKGSKSSKIAAEIRQDTAAIEQHRCSLRRFVQDDCKRFLIHATDDEAKLLSQIIRSAKPLREYGRISRGEEIGKKHVLERGPVPILIGGDIGRYSLEQPSRFIRKATKDKALYASPKIVIVKTGVRCIASIDHDSVVTMQSVYNLHLADGSPKPQCVLAVLNSRLVAWLIHKTFTAYKLLFPQLNQTTIEAVPIPVPDAKRSARIVKLVDRLFDLRQKITAAKIPSDKERISREIESADRNIDRLVYELYGLSVDEIAIVERDTEPPAVSA